MNLDESNKNWNIGDYSNAEILKDIEKGAKDTIWWDFRSFSISDNSQTLYGCIDMQVHKNKNKQTKTLWNPEWQA